MTLARVPILSPNYSSRGSDVRLIVLHTAEGSRTIESLGSWFQNPSSGVSSHTGADDKPDTVGEYVLAQYKAWTQANANPYSVSIELCGFAAWSSAEWHAHPNMLSNCAQWIAEESARFGVPIRALSAAEAQSGASGICQHVDLGADGGSHWDCGSGLPYGEILDMASGARPPSASVPPDAATIESEGIVISEVLRHRAVQLSCAQASNGQLWHKFSQDGGESWRSEPLIRPNGQPVKATVKDTVSISSVDGVLFITTEDEDGIAWCCRQSDDITTGWDIRRLP